MPDLISLTCPSCGGNLQITNDIDRLVCGHCGNEHIVRRSGGIASLTSTGSTLSRFSQFFLSGQTEKANAERLRIEQLIIKGELPEAEADQLRKLKSRYELVVQTFTRIRPDSDIVTALSEIDEVLELENAYLPALVSKGNRLFRAALGALTERDEVQFFLLLDRCVGTFSAAIRAHPRASSPYLMRGVARFHRNSWSFASSGHIDTEALNESAKDGAQFIELLIDEDSPPELVAAAWLQNGMVFQLWGDYYEKNLPIYDDPETDKLVHQRNSAYEKAASAFTHAIELSPKDSEAYKRRGQVIYRMSNTERWLEALGDLTQAIHLDPANLDARIELIKLLSFRGGNQSLDEIIEQSTYVLNFKPAVGLAAQSSVKTSLSMILSRVFREDPNNAKALQGLRVLEAVDNNAGNWTRLLTRKGRT